ncbi:hypothetical protein D5085_09820 [Ectothiorhodospiraceae bacterium BW-2]|nr:hypothetical protein D5085_09820 [Ectothiorhodospiraceae bacterium BW-2]
MTDQDTIPSAEALQALEALKTAVNKALNTKRRLGHYAVFWQDGKPQFIGEDAPLEGSDDLQQRPPDPKE